jgi:GxxExxY protein
MVNDEYSELTGNIIKHAVKVHRILGRGFPEVIYQRALAVEFKKSIGFTREKEDPLGTKKI